SAPIVHPPGPRCSLHSLPTRRSSDLVVHLAELTFLAVDRGDVDDAAELPRAHALDHRTGHVEQRAEIGVDHRAPLLERHFVKGRDRKSTRLNSSHVKISYAVFCSKKK